MFFIVIYGKYSKERIFLIFIFQMYSKKVLNFLQNHYNETIIMHLNDEYIPKINGIKMDISDLIYNHIKSFPKRYFYIDNTIPTLGNVRSKTVIITRTQHMNIIIKIIGNKILWNDMGNCQKYKKK